VDVCVRTDFCGNDVERVIEYAGRLGVKSIWAIPRIPEHCDQNKLVDGDRLAAYRDRFARSGLDVRMLTEIVDSPNLASDEAASRSTDMICRTVECIGAAGIDLLFLFLGAEAPADEDEAARQWERLEGLIRTVVPCAAGAGVKIASHGHQEARYLVKDYADLMRVVAAVDSPHNGVTFCPGCHQLMGDDLRSCIQGFGQKIFFAHARDVVRKGPGQWDEVLLGRGEVDPFRMIAELKAIGYRGLICPEHLPHVAYHPSQEIEAAWALGYLECLLSASGVRE